MLNIPSHDKYRLMVEINMVPLIDVALVLLIIFMVMTPILVKSQIRIQLPEAASGQRSPTEQAVEIQIVKDGSIYVQGVLVPKESLTDELRRHIPPTHDRPVAIHADKEVPFEVVVTVMDTARKLGVQTLNVGVKAVTAPRSSR